MRVFTVIIGLGFLIGLSSFAHAFEPDNGYYTNSDGNQVHRPVQSREHISGASARCRDGSESFSQHHSGTCSGHGGVLTWYNN